MTGHVPLVVALAGPEPINAFRQARQRQLHLSLVYQCGVWHNVETGTAELFCYFKSAALNFNSSE
jgi:hypothetical protein